ncbi:ABC transporter ATP-binding protein [Dictyobacter alpinus]|uniref:ABC transporter ATP-binding protein n=1 Tax=Dictyobacter alpinus TaxID=2014873 RepID=A0A402BAU3_9CHLR|nr:ABC transporter ATP-binding protein [Dictyobacter alpinus]
MLVLVFFLRSFFDYGQNYFAFYIGERLILNVRKQVFAHLQTLSLAFYSNQRTGDIMSRTTTDVQAMQMGLTSNVLNVAQDLVVLSGAVAIIVVMNWKLTLLIAVIVPIVMLIAYVLGKRLKYWSQRVQQELGNVNIVLEETLSSMRVVKSFTREAYEIGRFNMSTQKAFDMGMKRARVRSIFAPTLNFLAFGAMVLVIWYGSTEVLNGRLSPGQLISFAIYMFLIAEPIQSLSSRYVQVQEALGAASRIFEILDTPAERPDPPDAVVLPPLAGDIIFKQVSFAYSAQTPILEGLDFVISAGQTVAFVGPSGAGKTTLMNLLSRFYEPTQGQIFIDGHDLASIRIQSLREQIAIVPQEPVLFGGTIRDNIVYGRLEATEQEIAAAAADANASEFIEKLPQRYETIVGERGMKLSAGQRQRIAIARAVLRNPRILILDEATSSLDNESEVLVQEALNRLMQGRTTLVIAHRLTTIEHADAILILNQGRIVEQGIHADLLQQKGLYARLYTRQFHD